MEPSPASGPNVKDSVVSGDLHTGNVIHNHYHMPQQPPAAPQQPTAPPEALNLNPHLHQQQPQYQQPQTAPQTPFTNYYQQHGSRYIQNHQQKDVLITYLFWFLLGPLGGHRFYLNQIGMGVFYLLTFGGCGLLWLIDIALIPDLVNRANRVHIRN